MNVFPGPELPSPPFSLQEPWVLRRTRQPSSPQGNREVDCLTPRRGSNVQGVERGFPWVTRGTAGLQRDAPSSFSLPPSPTSSLFGVGTEKLIYQTSSSKAGVGFPSLRAPSPPTSCPPQIYLWGSVGLSQAQDPVYFIVRESSLAACWSPSFLLLSLKGGSPGFVPF